MNKPGPYEKKLIKHLKAKKCICFHASIMPDVTPEAAAKSILEMEAASERGEFTDTTNERL